MREDFKINNFLNNKTFWITYYFTILEDEEIETEESADLFFGLKTGEIDRFYSTILNQNKTMQTWPFVEIPIDERFSLGIEYAGIPDYEIRFFINNKAWNVPMVIGYKSDHFSLPVLRWDELRRISRLAGGENEFTILLLFLPGIYITDTDNYIEIKGTIEHAWSTLNIFQYKEIELLTGKIIKHQKENIHWWEDEQLGWINNGQYSFRNPKNEMHKFDKCLFERISILQNILDSTSVNI
jgi:hypothetical protein